MIKRTITAAAILAVVIPAILFGGWALAGLIGFIIIGSGIEWTKTAPNISKWPLWFRFLLIAIVLFSVYLPSNKALGVLGLAAVLCFTTPVFLHTLNYQDTYTGLSYIIVFFILGKGFLTIHEANNNYIWLIILITYACDTGAYLTGRLFGKHKLAPEISPKKTIEGAIGGWLLGGILGCIAILFFFKEIPLSSMFLICTVLPFVSQLGDLSFSAIKRNTNIKDFSNLLPGHGGILDRIDSLVFTVIAFYAICINLGVI